MKTVGKEIIDGLNRGSESAFAALYDSYFSYLCACAATYVPDPVSAEELVNDVFVNIWEHRGRYRVPLHGYLVNSVRNACISHIRSQLFRRRLREGYERELLLFAEQRCLTDAHPLEVLSAQEVETRIRLSSKRFLSAAGPSSNNTSTGENPPGRPPRTCGSPPSRYEFTSRTLSTAFVSN